MNKVTFEWKNNLIRFICENRNTDRAKRFMQYITEYTEKGNSSVPIGLLIQNTNYIDVSNMYMDVQSYFIGRYPRGESMFVATCNAFMDDEKNRCLNNL